MSSGWSRGGAAPDTPRTYFAPCSPDHPLDNVFASLGGAQFDQGFDFEAIPVSRSGNSPSLKHNKFGSGLSFGYRPNKEVWADNL